MFSLRLLELDSYTIEQILFQRWKLFQTHRPKRGKKKKNQHRRGTPTTWRKKSGAGVIPYNHNKRQRGEGLLVEGHVAREEP